MASTVFFGNRALGSIVVVVLLVVAFLVFWPGGGPESEIETKLERLALAGDITPSDAPRARVVELTVAVNTALAKDVVVRIGDQDGELNGREAVLARLERAVVSVRDMRVTLRGLTIMPGGRDASDGEAWHARFFLDAMGAGPYGSVRDTRRITARFEELDGQWMMTFADVSSRDDAEPEERP